MNIRSQFEAATEHGAWLTLSESLTSGGQQLEEHVRQTFSTYWIVAGHHIRRQIQPDARLISFLRFMFGAYDGAAAILYRGENLARYKAGRIGIAWSSSIETARMFGSGLNSVHGGGVLLMANFQPEAILCGPNAHSKYLGESQFSVDPAMGTDFQVLEYYPDVDHAK